MVEIFSFFFVCFFLKILNLNPCLVCKSSTTGFRI